MFTTRVLCVTTWSKGQRGNGVGGLTALSWGVLAECACYLSTRYYSSHVRYKRRCFNEFKRWKWIASASPLTSCGVEGADDGNETGRLPSVPPYVMRQRHWVVKL